MKKFLFQLSVFACVYVVGVISQPAFGAEKPKEEKIADFDKRVRPSAVAEAQAAKQHESDLLRLRATSGAVKAEYDQLVGTPRLLQNQDGPLIKGTAGEGKHAPAAKMQEFVGRFINQYPNLFGHSSAVLDAASIRQDAGKPGEMRSIRWDQELDEIPVFGATMKVNFNAQGEIINILGGLLPDVRSASGAADQKRAAAIASPAINGSAALVLAAKSLGDLIQASDLTALGEPAGSTKKQVFSTPLLKDAQVALVWLPTSRTQLRLCWEVILTSRSLGAMFQVMVDAENGDALLRHCLTNDLAATYSVYNQGSPTPLSPGLATPAATQPATVLRQLMVDPNVGLRQWIPDGGTTTTGNNVDAYTDIFDNDAPDALSRPTISGTNSFETAIDLTLQPNSYSRASVTNLFYWCNWMHDQLYSLGFDEAHGCFQTTNTFDGINGGGIGGDAVLAEAQDSRQVGYIDPVTHQLVLIRNNAFFSTSADGNPSRMEMYIFSGSPEIDGSLDAQIILHEYTHGLSQRLIGNGSGLPLTAIQSSGMGEGWSDFYALALLTNPADPLDSPYPMGAYATRGIFTSRGFTTQNYYYGIRRYPYSTNLTTICPLTYRDIDPNQISSYAGISRNPTAGSNAAEIHNIGEVWCAILWDVRAAMIANAPATGNWATLKLVTDAMKLTPSSPTFIDARDAIYAADVATNGGVNIPRLRRAFARRGLGVYATAPVSTTSTGVVASGHIAAVTFAGTTNVIASTSMTIAGRGLDGVLSLNINGLTVTPTNSTYSNLTFMIPALADGLYPVTLNPAPPVGNDAPGLISAGSLNVLSLPTINGLAPSIVPSGGSLTITGTNFQNVTGVLIGTTSFLITQRTATQLVVTVPALFTPGTYPISLTSLVGTVVSPTTVRIHNPAKVTSINLSSGCQGAKFIITGTDFEPTEVQRVNFGIYTGNHTILSSTQIEATVRTNGALGSQPVTVTVLGVNTAPALAFTVYDRPLISSTPATIREGQTIAVIGTNFYNFINATIDSIPVTATRVSATRVDVVVPKPFNLGLATLALNCNGSTATRLISIDEALPAISSFTPTSGPIGTIVTITGTNLARVGTVKIGTHTAFADSATSTQVVFKIPNFAVNGTLTVSTPNFATATSAGSFTVKHPTITSFTPTTAAIGEWITVNGTNLSNVYQIIMGWGRGYNAPWVQIISATQIKVRVPSYAESGTIGVFASFNGLQDNAVSAGSFTVKRSTISSFTPSSATVGSTISITGTNYQTVLSSGASVSYTIEFAGGVSSAATVISATQLSAVIPAGATTGKIVVYRVASDPLEPALDRVTSVANLTILP